MTFWILFIALLSKSYHSAFSTFQFNVIPLQKFQFNVVPLQQLIINGQWNDYSNFTKSIQWLFYEHINIIHTTFNFNSTFDDIAIFNMETLINDYGYKWTGVTGYSSPRGLVKLLITRANLLNFLAECRGLTIKNNGSFLFIHELHLDILKLITQLFANKYHPPINSNDLTNIALITGMEQHPKIQAKVAEIYSIILNAFTNSSNCVISPTSITFSYFMIMIDTLANSTKLFLDEIITAQNYILTYFDNDYSAYILIKFIKIIADKVLIEPTQNNSSNTKLYQTMDLLWNNYKSYRITGANKRAYVKNTILFIRIYSLIFDDMAKVEEIYQYLLLFELRVNKLSVSQYFAIMSQWTEMHRIKFNAHKQWRIWPSNLLNDIELLFSKWLQTNDRIARELSGLMLETLELLLQCFMSEKDQQRIEIVRTLQNRVCSKKRRLY